MNDRFFQKQGKTVNFPISSYLLDIQILRKYHIWFSYSTVIIGYFNNIFYG